MARAALDALGRAPELECGKIETRVIPLSLQLKDLSAQIASARATLEQTTLSLESHRGGDFRLGRLQDEHQKAQTMLASLEALQENNRRDRRIVSERNEIATRVSLIRIGEVAFVGIPGEAFVEFGLALKANSGFEHTFVIGYCNDLIGYIPTRQSYEFGGYEVWSARIAAGMGELLISEALKGLRQLKSLSRDEI